MSDLRLFAIVLLLAGGVFFTAVAAIGLVRLPDLYTRAHAASKADTLGAAMTLAAVALAFGTDVTIAKAAMLLLFMFITNPTAAHAITRAAYDQGIEPWTVGNDDSEQTPVADAEGDA